MGKRIYQHNVGRMTRTLFKLIAAADDLGIPYRIHIKLDTDNIKDQAIKEQIMNDMKRSDAGKAGKIVIS